ncbi:hypothetical protein GIB67_011740 [Kingdonia uniflora]|uniref:Uncharacterized protein n=1 Tax=Kingdonia uniflora TaxID=39325 RepID=A0A7J7LUP1_9MAGN|nr:hypothetical protein GIB67_011740 [Kingdonia uniflora]
MTFDFRHTANFSIMRRMNDAWKRHKSRLNKKYIKVVERNFPDEDAGKTDVFIKAHTKIDKTYQCPKIIEKLQENMILYPDSNKMGYDDVLTKTLGKDKKGHMMAMGIDITPSFMTNAIHIVEENEDLKATNNELKTMLLTMKKDLPHQKNIGKLHHKHNPLRLIMQQQKKSDLHRECKLNGCPEGIVIYGGVADVSPDAYCHNKQLGDEYYKIEIFNVINKDALLFRQDSFTKTIGDSQAWINEEGEGTSKDLWSCTLVEEDDVNDRTLKKARRVVSELRNPLAKVVFMDGLSPLDEDPIKEHLQKLPIVELHLLYLRMYFLFSWDKGAHDGWLEVAEAKVTRQVAAVEVLVEDEEERKMNFLKGLRPYFRKFLIASGANSYREILSKALAIEQNDVEDHKPKDLRNQVRQDQRLDKGKAVQSQYENLGSKRQKFSITDGAPARVMGGQHSYGPRFAFGEC